jgi:hypothetical protein
VSSKAILLIFGLVCIISAVIRGGLRSPWIEFPRVESVPERSALLVLGTILVIASLLVDRAPPDPPVSLKPPPPIEPTMTDAEQRRLRKEKPPPPLPPPQATTLKECEKSLPNSNDKLSKEGELIKNGKFESFYQPDWIPEIYDINASIQSSKNYVSISFSVDGANLKSVVLYQIIDIHDPMNLIFNLRIKISDFDNYGFPVAALTFMDDTDKKIFRMIFTPDKHHYPETTGCLYSIRNGLLEDIIISPFESVRTQLP